MTMTIRSSVGMGLIWDSPLGPLRFDFAYALTKASYDQRSSSASAAARSSDLDRAWRHGTGGMSEPVFQRHARGLTLAEIAALTGATPPPAPLRTRRIADVAPLDRAAPGDLTFFDNKNYAAAAGATHAGACLTTAALAKHLPAACAGFGRARALSRLRHGGARIVSACAAAVLARRGRQRWPAPMCTRPRGWKTASPSSPAR